LSVKQYNIQKRVILLMKNRAIKFLKKPLVKSVLIGLGLFVLLIIIISYLLRFYTRHGESIPLPDYIGKTLEQAMEVEESKKFSFIVIDSVYMPEKPKGSIYTQDPPGETPVKSGRKIYVTTVAYGVPTVNMPNLIDLSLRQATNLLESIGLNVANIIYEESKFDNAVFKQLYKGREILPGTEIKQGEKISLVVGRDSSLIENESEINED